MKEKYIEVDRDQFKAFAEWPIDTPLYMYNLLKYKNTLADSEVTGEAAYRNYMKAATPFFQQSNAEIIFFGSPQFILIGDSEDEYWDDILLVRYESKNDFLGMVTAEGYPAALRKEALEDSRLIYCKSKIKNASKG